MVDSYQMFRAASGTAIRIEGGGGIMREVGGRGKGGGEEETAKANACRPGDCGSQEIVLLLLAAPARWASSPGGES